MLEIHRFGAFQKCFAKNNLSKFLDVTKENNSNENKSDKANFLTV